jgi:hypothetical protein
MLAANSSEMQENNRHHDAPHCSPPLWQGAKKDVHAVEHHELCREHAQELNRVRRGEGRAPTEGECIIKSILLGQINAATASCAVVHAAQNSARAFPNPAGGIPILNSPKSRFRVVRVIRLVRGPRGLLKKLLI